MSVGLNLDLGSCWYWQTIKMAFEGGKNLSFLLVIIDLYFFGKIEEAKLY